jgi:hypothetical protein
VPQERTAAAIDGARRLLDADWLLGGRRPLPAAIRLV